MSLYFGFFSSLALAMPLVKSELELVWRGSGCFCLLAKLLDLFYSRVFKVRMSSISDDISDGSPSSSGPNFVEVGGEWSLSVKECDEVGDRRGGGCSGSPTTTRASSAAIGRPTSTILGCRCSGDKRISPFIMII